jgi:hypothetical protein
MNNKLIAATDTTSALVLAKNNLLNGADVTAHPLL